MNKRQGKRIKTLLEMSDGTWKGYEEEWFTHLDKSWEDLISENWGEEKKTSLTFTNDWKGLEFTPCIDLELQIFDVSLITFYILPHNHMAGFQLFGLGIRWSW